VIRSVREIAARLHRPIALLQDLSGPKIRTGKVKDGEVQLVKGARLAVTTDTAVEGTAELISTTYELLPRDVKAATNPARRRQPRMVSRARDGRSVRGGDWGCARTRG
jgi:pyruvate kinase